MRRINYWELVISLEIVKSTLLLGIAEMASIVGVVVGENYDCDSVKIIEVKENVLRTIHPGNTAIDVTIRAGAYDWESICEILRRLYSHYNDASLQSIRFVGEES